MNENQEQYLIERLGGSPLNEAEISASPFVWNTEMVNLEEYIIAVKGTMIARAAYIWKHFPKKIRSFLDTNTKKKHKNGPKVPGLPEGMPSFYYDRADTVGKLVSALKKEDIKGSEQRSIKVSV